MEDEDFNNSDEEEEQKQEAIDMQDAQQAQLDEQSEMQENQGDILEAQAYGNPMPAERERDSVYTFFKRILGLKDTSRVANLDKRELGMTQLSVRSNQHLALVGSMLHDPTYSDYFKKQSEIITSTSMSKKGWLPELVVSQKKVSSRNIQPVKLPDPPKKKFLGGIA